MFQAIPQSEKSIKGNNAQKDAPKVVLLLLSLFQEKTYSKENETAKMDKLISFVREPLLDMTAKDI